jgi:hypothetical protein
MAGEGGVKAYCDKVILVIWAMQVLDLRMIENQEFTSLKSSKSF